MLVPSLNGKRNTLNFSYFMMIQRELYKLPIMSAILKISLGTKLIIELKFQTQEFKHVRVPYYDEIIHHIKLCLPHVYANEVPV